MKSVIIRRKRSGQAVFLFCSVMVFVFFILMIFSSEIPQEFRGFFSAVGWAGSILAGINPAHDTPPSPFNRQHRRAF